MPRIVNAIVPASFMVISQRGLDSRGSRAMQIGKNGFHPVDRQSGAVSRLGERDGGRVTERRQLLRLNELQ